MAPKVRGAIQKKPSAAGAAVTRKRLASASDNSQGVPETEKLADAYETAMYGGASASSSEYGPVQERLQELGVHFVESKTVLFVLCPQACLAFEDKVLKKLRHKGTIRKLRFHGIQDGEDPGPAFDFRHVGPLIRQYLPELGELGFQFMAVKNFSLTGVTSLRQVYFVGARFQDDNVFDMELPELKSLNIALCTPPSQGLAASLLKCPRIESFYAHKFMDDPPSLYLPSCKTFCFRRGDCVSKLHLYLPRVEKVVLDAMYDLKNLKFLPQGKKEIKEFALPKGTPESTFTVSVVNACLGTAAKQYLSTHPRVRRIDGLSDNDDPLF
ncbi:unnamed protein product [Polarella glacialis]|uniref:Uncharacterized protein n=1 Tax=Polarella glacialis TaxID=89957 RepID=A0A813LEK7_POLGL|nr:unnamed protein product [Polarella glacialis]CAE8613800.1 unnamed protein product [Polarella glacialis]CAE8725365.1 unnamed protein product [Polarella glacialis]